MGVISILGHSKQVSLKEDVSSSYSRFIVGLPLCVLALVFVFAFFGVPGVIISLCVVLFIHRLFFAKLIPHPGSVILFFGLPGSGKTCFLTKVADDVRRDRNYQNIFVNSEFSHCKLANGVFERDDLAKFRFDAGGSSVLLFDEASLNGFDNRDYKVNFSGESGSDVLEFFKKIRQYNSSIVFSNQGWDELDKKLREGLCNRVYYVRNRGFYSVASCLIPEISISRVDGSIQQGYRSPRMLDRLLDPTLQLYVIHRYAGKYFQSIHPRPRPYFSRVSFDELPDDSILFKLKKKLKHS